MIPTDSATLRAKGLHAEAQKQSYPLRAFVGFYHGKGGLRLGVRTTRSYFVRSLPQVEMLVTPAMDAEHLQQMIEDAWHGLYRDRELLEAKRNSKPDRRHGWRTNITNDCAVAREKQA